MSEIVNEAFTIVGGCRPASAAAAVDWCSELVYSQVDPCCVRQFLSVAARTGICPSIPFFFGLSPGCCGPAGQYRPPTDEGVDPTLPKLPLGYHYPQTSTDRSCGRASAGRWALERGKIFLTPWIQSTETVVVMWDGIKRVWADGDLVDNDPLLTKAVEEYLRWQHAEKFDRDYSAAGVHKQAYEETRMWLIHQCREETRARDCEPSHARGSNLTQLYYNEEQSFTAQCADDSTGAPVTVTIASGTVGSVVSVADANQKAKDEAQQQAMDRLDCTANTPTYTNDQQSATAYCTGGAGAPAPDGNPATVIVPAGTYTSTVSKEEANAQALAAAQAQASAQLSCTWWNAEQSYTASCPEGSAGSDVTKTTAPHTNSSTLSQADADAQALNAAKGEAEAALDCTGSPTVYWNTVQYAQRVATGCGPAPGCNVIVNVTVRADKFSSVISQADANQRAYNYGKSYADGRALLYCALAQCGQYDLTI